MCSNATTGLAIQPSNAPTPTRKPRCALIPVLLHISLRGLPSDKQHNMLGHNTKGIQDSFIDIDLGKDAGMEFLHVQVDCVKTEI